MGLETRLVRRKNGTYAFRGYVPPELREAIPGGRSGQKWIALGTADRAEAVRRARLKSVEFDRELHTARRRLSGAQDDISLAEAERLAAAWLSKLLSDDERKREAGLTEVAYQRALKAAEYVGPAAAAELARGSMETIWMEVEGVLRENGLSSREGSESWRRLGFAMLKAQKRWADALLARNKGEVVETPVPPKAASTPRSCTVEDLITAYLNDPTRKRTPGTLKTYQTVFRAMRELLGPDTPVDSIHRVDCERIRSVIIRLPKNASQRFPDLSLEDAAKLADAEKLERLGVSAVNNYLHNLSALFKWGVNTWRVTRNPAQGLALPDDRDERDLRQPFSIAQLQAIFTAPLYTGCQDDEEGYAKPGPNVPRRGRFWVPLLSLWTGMRLGECCQLRVEDVAEYEGVPVILINDDEEPGGDEADKKRVKTEAGRRFVPVHPELQRIGFLKFVEAMRGRGEKRLFPEIKPDSMGYLSGTFSKWFNDKRRFLGKLDMSGTGVSFHSFRHNYRDALREAEISLERVRALGGWRRDSEGEEAIYGKGLKAATLYKEIEKVRYSGLALTHLHTG
ncbi:site-specific integrase [Methylobacterium sp. CB376]|uniref:site-specific integrase n=1 Tax=unclassified Methylobacterium TaxID=2615210 RepID=UPI000A026FA2|nr:MULTISPECIES: site-specific integrase [Methylobacterium]WFT79822.1 site-specific integrase [Methylobacterium nodulans]